MISSRKLHVDAKTGKISLARALNSCRNCNYHALEIQMLKLEIFFLRKDLAYR